MNLLKKHLTAIWLIIICTSFLNGQDVKYDDQIIQFVLEGRKAQNFTLPNDGYQRGAHVVVEVSVDRLGKVVQAIPGARGSTTLDENLLRAAMEAAKRVQFDPNLQAPVIQKGTITFNFLFASNTTNSTSNLISSPQPNYSNIQTSKIRTVVDENSIKHSDEMSLQGQLDIKSNLPIGVTLKRNTDQLVERELKREKGTFVFADGSIYEGKREKGMAEGIGKRIFHDGSVYEGQFRQGFYEGYGILTEKEQGRYEGYFVKGKREGQGRQTFINNDIYQGNWANGFQNGKGKCVYKNGSSYEGNWVNGKREGNGKLVVPNTFTYKGELSDDNLNGEGEIIYSNGDIYTGQWESGKMSGFGILTLSNGEIYDGFWVNGQKNGRGKLKYREGVIYDGIFFNGKRHGEGQITFSNGTYYKGAWVNDAATGKGEQTSSDGSKYSGDFVNGMMHGKGMLIYKNGRVYEGDWANNKPTGKGKMIYEGGSVYAGDFVNGRKHGKGTIKFDDGSTYEGYWENDLMSGQGKMTQINGEVYEGGFLNGRRNGTAKYSYPDGRVFIAEFANDWPIGKGTLIETDGSIIEGEWEDGEFLIDKEQSSISSMHNLEATNKVASVPQEKGNEYDLSKILGYYRCEDDEGPISLYGQYTYAMFNGKRVILLAMGSRYTDAFTDVKTWLKSGTFTLNGNYINVKWNDGKTNIWTIADLGTIKMSENMTLEKIAEIDGSNSNTSQMSSQRTYTDNSDASSYSSKSTTGTLFRSEGDVFLFLNNKKFTNSRDALMTFGDMGSSFTIREFLFFNPEVVLVSRTRAIIKYYQADDPSSTASFTVNGENNTLTTRGSGTIWWIEN